MLKHRYLFPFFVLWGIGSLVLLYKTGNYSSLLLCLILALGLTSWGAFDLRLSYFIPAHWRKQHPAKGQIALTFDDGPTPYTAAVLRLLKHYDYKATFFCIGKQVKAYPDLARQIVAEGHTIANHSYNHLSSFGFLQQAALLDELQQTDQVIWEVTGQKPSLFRPPFGVSNPTLAKVLQISKHQTIGWSNRSLDTVTADPLRIERRVRKKLQSGDIILFHDSSQRTLDALQRLLPYLKEQGYVSLSVDDLLALQRYET